MPQPNRPRHLGQGHWERLEGPPKQAHKGQAPSRGRMVMGAPKRNLSNTGPTGASCRQGPVAMGAPGGLSQTKVLAIGPTPKLAPQGPEAVQGPDGKGSALGALPSTGPKGASNRQGPAVLGASRGPSQTKAVARGPRSHLRAPSRPAAARGRRLVPSRSLIKGIAAAVRSVSCARRLHRRDALPPLSFYGGQHVRRGGQTQTADPCSS